jgi:predicted amidohydrolase
VTSVRIGCAQIPPKVGDLEGNRWFAKTGIRELGVRGSRIILLPELMSSGYVFDSVEEAEPAANQRAGRRSRDGSRMPPTTGA